MKTLKRNLFFSKENERVLLLLNWNCKRTNSFIFNRTRNATNSFFQEAPNADALHPLPPAGAFDPNPFAGLFSCFYLCTGSRRTRRRKTEICRRAATWRNSSGCGRGLGKPAPPSGSSGRTASTCSGCARDQIYSSRAPGERHSGIVLLQTHTNNVAVTKLSNETRTTNKPPPTHSAPSQPLRSC